MIPPTPRGPSRATLGVVAGVLAVAVLMLAGLILYTYRHELPFWPGSGAPTPPEVVEASVGPVATGQLVQPSAPGATPVLSADTIALHRPTFRFQGNQPWQIRARPHDTVVLEGYASRPSYLAGETLRLAVSTSAPSFDLTVWRVSGSAPVVGPFVMVGELRGLPGRLQGPPLVDPVTKLVAARWQYDVSYRIPAGWPSDIYLVRLDSTEGVQSYVPFVVRSPAAHRILVVSNAMNWEAYNQWGGSSVYTTKLGEPLPGVKRALGVTFDRPYASDGGAGQLFFLELPFVSWILRQGLDIAFTTDYDLSLDPSAQPLPKVVVFNGHGEYWTPRLYEWVDHHVNEIGDMSVAMLAADSGYWPVEFAHRTADGPRDMIVYKNGPVPATLSVPGVTPEPLETEPPAGSPGAAGSGGPGGSGASGSSPGAGGSGASPGASSPPDTEERAKTVLWTIPPAGPYVGSFPGQPVFGVHYQGVTTALGRYRVDPSPPVRFLQGTGLSADSSLGFLAGGEVDGVLTDGQWWGPMGGRYDHSFATATDIPGRTADARWTAQAVWRDLPNGGRVFSSGTFYWGWALDPAWADAHQVPAGFGRLTLNLLEWLGGS